MTLIAENNTVSTELAIRPATREQWLESAVLALRPYFTERKLELPAVRVSVGWPSRGGTGKAKRVIGQCWKTTVAGDGVAQIFVSPTLGEHGEVLAVLVHELVHAWDDCESGHKGDFATAAKSLGLEGKMTATHAGEALSEFLGTLVDRLGAYPHSALNFSEMEKQRAPQKTRMIKLMAPDCDYTVRTTQKWIDEGMPKCPHDVEMQLA